MKEISDYSIKKRFVAENCNFIAFCITSWHLLGVRAFLQYLREHDVIVKGFICVVAHSDSGYVLNDDDAQQYEGLEFVKLIATPQSGIKKVIGQVLDFIAIEKIREKGLNKVYIVSPWRPNFEWSAFLSKVIKDKEIQSVVVDEGLAEYIDEKDKNVHTHSRLFVPVIYHYLKDKYFKSKLETIMIERGLVTQFSLLNPNPFVDGSKSGRYIQNDTAVACYMKSLKSGPPVEKRKLEVYENAVIINTQPFIEAGELLTDKDLDLLEEIIILLSGKGIKAVLKPHPRETNIRRYQYLVTDEKCIIDADNKISQEAILSQLTIKPKAIIGFTSTTLLTAKLFYGIETISVVNCMDRNNFADFQQSTITNFIDAFRQIIHCINDVNEIMGIIK